MRAGRRSLAESRVGAVNDLGTDLVALAVFQSRNHRLANRTASSVLEHLARGVAHVLALAAELRIRGFDKTRKIAALRSRPSFPDTVRHEPGGGLDTHPNPDVSLTQVYQPNL